MKARIKGSNDLFREIENVEIKGIGYSYSAKDVEFEPTPDYWQDLRERAAIAAMQGLLAHNDDAYNELFIAKEALIYADALVEKLKGK